MAGTPSWMDSSGQVHQGRHHPGLQVTSRCLSFLVCKMKRLGGFYFQNLLSPACKISIKTKTSFVLNGDKRKVYAAVKGPNATPGAVWRGDRAGPSPNRRRSPAGAQARPMAQRAVPFLAAGTQPGHRPALRAPWPWESGARARWLGGDALPFSVCELDL